MGIKEEDEEEGNAKKYIGRKVRKHFKGFGDFIGEVISFHKGRKFYKVKYADGDREELDLSELKPILVDVETSVAKDDSKPKGASGRKRKRDQPVKYAKGVVENTSSVRSEQPVSNVVVATPNHTALAKRPPQATKLVESTVSIGARIESPEVAVEAFRLETEPSQVPTLNTTSGPEPVEDTAEDLEDGRGKKRAVECATPVVEVLEVTRPTRMRKRARAASEVAAAARQRTFPDQAGQHETQTLVGSSLYAHQSQIGTNQDGSITTLSLRATCTEQNVILSQSSEKTGLNGSITSSLGDRQQWGLSNELSNSGARPAVASHQHGESVAKDVFSLRAIRAISRSLPVQRNLATAETGEESEATDSESNQLALPKQEVEIEVVSLKHPLPASSTCLGGVEDCVADLFQAFSFLRSFSHALFLSPFNLEEFVVALTSVVVSPMIDCVHVSLLQGLRRHLERLCKNGSNSATFCLRLLDWSLLDNITWPSYLMAYLLTQDFTSGRGWSFMKARHTKMEYYKLPVRTKLAFLNFLCDKALETDEVRTELTRRIALENDAEMLETKALTSKRPDRNQRDNISLEGEFEEEFERMTRQKRDAAVGKPPLSGEIGMKGDKDNKHLEQGEDGNLDECVLCAMDGVLICCDGCPAAYHSRCVGITKQGLPPGDWFCPECRADKLESKGVHIPKGVRGAELLLVTSDGQRFFSNCGYLLVSESGSKDDSNYRYYSPRDMHRLVKYLEDEGPGFAGLKAAVLQLCQPDLDPMPAPLQTELTAPPSGSILVEEKKIDLSLVSPPVRDPAAAIATHSPSFSPGLLHVKQDAGVPALRTFKGEDGQQQENIDSRSDPPAEQITSDQSSILTLDPPTVPTGLLDDPPKVSVLKEENLAASKVVSQQQLDLAGGQISSASATGLPAGYQTLPPQIGLIEPSDRPTEAEKPKSRQNLNGKYLPRQQEGNFSSLTQINACAYINKYTNGDIVFTAATILAAMALEDATDDKGGSQRKVKPPSASDQLKAFSQAAPDFFWPSLKKRAMEAPKEKCGWCINCRTPNRKGCLLTQVTGQICGGAAAITGGIKPIKGAYGHYPAVAAYMLYMEDNLHGLLGGPWEVFGYRKLWRKRVEQGKSIEDVRSALLEMESSLPKSAIMPDWDKVMEDAPPLVAKCVIHVSGAGAIASKKGAPKRRGRPPIIAKTPAVVAYDGACFGVKWWRGGKLSRQVYNWESLPRIAVKRAARQGGMKEIPELVYSKSVDLPRRTQQCAWRARTEKVSAVAQLAVQVRSLDRFIKWSEIVSPLEASTTHNVKSSIDSTMSKAEILSKSEEDGCIKYLLHVSRDGGDAPESSHQQVDSATKSGNGNNGNKKLLGGHGEECDQWIPEKDVPLFLLKDYEQKQRKINHIKLHKSVKARKVHLPLAEKKLTFWEMVSDPLLYESQETKKLSSWICGHCRLSCSESQSLQCQRCTEKFHINCTEVEETIDGREKVAVCKSCAKLRLGQRNRKPSYKMRIMQSQFAEGSFAGSSKGVAMGDAEDLSPRSGSTPKSSSRKKDRGYFTSESSPENDFSQSGKRKSAKKKNGLLPGSSFSDHDFDIHFPGESKHVHANGSVKVGNSKSGRKVKSLFSVPTDSQPSPDMPQIERRSSIRIKNNSMSPVKSPLSALPDHPLRVKLKLGKKVEKDVDHSLAVSIKDDDNRQASKRKIGLRNDRGTTGADLSEDDTEFAQLDRKRSPQKRRRLKVLMKGLPITDDAESNDALPQNARKKASNGLQYVRRKKKSDEEVAAFRQERLVFPGREGIEPSTAPGCALCSEGYDPRYSFISCEWCEEWYHGDAVGLTQDDAEHLVGFKCHKCRKCRAPSCPVSGTRQRPSAAKVRRRGSIDHGEVIDAENVNRSVQAYPSEKDFCGFNDVKAFPDFVAATNQAEQALAVDGSNFGHGLVAPDFDLTSGLMCDLEHPLQLTTPLSSLGEHNVNLWASNNGSGQLDLPSDFSSQLDLSSRATASLSFTELLASDDDYLEGVAGPGLPLGATWSGDAAVAGSGLGAGAGWCGGDGVARPAEIEPGVGWTGVPAVAASDGVDPSSEWSGDPASTASADLDPSSGWSAIATTTGASAIHPTSVWSGGPTPTGATCSNPSGGWTGVDRPVGLGGTDPITAGWAHGEGEQKSLELSMRDAWGGRMHNLSSIATHTDITPDTSAAF